MYRLFTDKKLKIYELYYNLCLEPGHGISANYECQIPIGSKLYLIEVKMLISFINLQRLHLLEKAPKTIRVNSNPYEWEKFYTQPTVSFCWRHFM